MFQARPILWSAFVSLSLAACTPATHPVTPTPDQDGTSAQTQPVDPSPLDQSDPRPDKPSAPTTPLVVPQGPFETRPIDVHIAFDGSHTLSVWQDTLDFAKQHNVRFTFFIVGTHLLNDDLSQLYDPPRRRRGRSDVGFGGTRDEVEMRLNMIRRAYAEGHEIGGHANGHWDGSDFTYEEWVSELTQFKDFVANAYTLNDLEDPDPELWRRLTQDIIGFRAPLLAHNAPMYSALREMGYRYDTSQVRRLSPTGIYYDQGFPVLPLAPVTTGRGRTIAMDYNFFVLDKGRVEGSGANMLNAYRKHLRDAQKRGAAAIQIGHHFSRWNKGQYWWALKEFIKEFCDTDHIRCTPLEKRLTAPVGTAPAPAQTAEQNPAAPAPAAVDPE